MSYCLIFKRCSAFQICIRYIVSPKKLSTMRQITEYLSKRMGVRKSYFADLEPREHLMKYVPKSQKDLEPRSLKDSNSQAIIPLSTDLSLQDMYVGYQGKTRIGRILEHMDLFACYVLMKHVKLPNVTSADTFPYYIVTANVDKIDFVGARPLPQKDMLMAGHVSWVGKSSAEITISLKQQIDNELLLITTAIFVMVVRNALNTGPGILNPVKPANKEEVKILEMAKKRKAKRDEFRKKSLLRILPSPEEQKVIHSLFLRTIKINDNSPSTSYLPKHCIWLEESMTTVFQAHVEHRNINNSVFGGLIMRQAQELSWNLAILFSDQRPRLKRVSDVKFIRPVRLNSIMQMDAQVVYTNGGYLMIRTIAHVVSSLKLKDMTNEFYFTYLVPETLPEVIPKSYKNAMIYLEAKRHFDAFIDDHNQPGRGVITFRE